MKDWQEIRGNKIEIKKTKRIIVKSSFDLFSLPRMRRARKIEFIAIKIAESINLNWTKDGVWCFAYPSLRSAAGNQEPPELL